jgi:hypothetical protein
MAINPALPAVMVLAPSPSPHHHHPLPPGVKQYTVGSRFACLGVKFLEYSLAGITCGFIGQGIANSLMLLK